MDRAHRIGQKKVVNVYRLITRGTLEEKIMRFASTVITSCLYRVWAIRFSNSPPEANLRVAQATSEAGYNLPAQPASQAGSLHVHLLHKKGLICSALWQSLSLVEGPKGSIQSGCQVSGTCQVDAVNISLSSVSPCKATREIAKWPSLMKNGCNRVVNRSYIAGTL